MFVTMPVFGKLFPSSFRSWASGSGTKLFSLTITGSVGLGIAERTQIPFVQEVVASTAYVRRYHPQATTPRHRRRGTPKSFS